MIGIPVLAVLALAGYRATQLAVWDSILDPARNRVMDWQARRPDSSLRAAVLTLITCVYCAGWWLSGAVLALYLTTTGTWHGTPVAVHALEWLAVAGGAVLLNRWDDTRKADA